MRGARRATRRRAAPHGPPCAFARRTQNRAADVDGGAVARDARDGAPQPRERRHRLCSGHPGRRAPRFPLSRARRKTVRRRPCAKQRPDAARGHGERGDRRRHHAGHPLGPGRHQVDRASAQCARQAGRARGRRMGSLARRRGRTRDRGRILERLDRVGRGNADHAPAGYRHSSRHYPRGGDRRRRGTRDGACRAAVHGRGSPCGARSLHHLGEPDRVAGDANRRPPGRRRQARPDRRGAAPGLSPTRRILLIRQQQRRVDDSPPPVLMNGRKGEGLHGTGTRRITHRRRRSARCGDGGPPRRPPAAGRQALRRGSSAKPDHFDALHMLGVIKLQHGELGEALRLMLRALETEPRSPDVLINYGLTLNALNRLDEALASFDAAIAIKPDAAAYNNRGSVLNKLGRLEEAIASYGKAIALQPDYPEAYFNRSNVYIRQMRYAEALKDADRAIALRPNYVKAHNNRANALNALRRYQESLQAAERTVALDPHYAAGHYSRGNALARLGRHAEALEAYQRAVALDPNHAEAQWNEALTRLRLGDLRGGFDKYEWGWMRFEAVEYKRRNFARPVW